MAEYSIINPKVQIMDYGPKLINPETGKVLMTPDQIVALSSGWTYKNTDAFQNLEALKKEEKDLNASAKKILIQSAGRGHASLSTSTGLWINIQNSSKMVDSYFTGANFGSALMPSGRRTGINLEQIVIPENIAKADPKIQRIYIETSENNIKTYQELLDAGIKQDAAGKIVQYGIAGGGFMFMPLETFVGFDRDYEANFENIPKEIGQILEQIKEEFPKLGMNMTYASRKNAGRSTYPAPTIFKSERNDLSNEIWVNPVLKEYPEIKNIKNLTSNYRKEDISILLKNMQKIMGSPESISREWWKSLSLAEKIIKKYNSTLEITINSLVPWRVWGEIKRHRTMQQDPESIYHSIERTSRELFKISDPSEFEKYVSLPPEIKSNPELLKKWIDAFKKSFKAYDGLVEDNNIPRSDAIQVIPRGLKIANQKAMDFYNLTLGYLSLRLCGTAEEEMKRSSEQELKLIQDSHDIDSDIKQLIRPKCGYVGFCLEPWAKCKNCLKVQKYVPFEYNEKIHAFFESTRKEAIDATLTSLESD